MDAKMEEVQEKGCVFEESLEIDFDYEFDVAKFFDFTLLETPEEILESELWFEISLGHSPSPLLVKLEKEADDLADSVTSPCSRYGSSIAYSVDNDSGGSQVSSIDGGKKGPKMLKSKLKSTSLSKFPVNSRLLKPTESLLAKKDQHAGGRSTTALRRHQKLGNPLKSPGEADATKRQKLEKGYLRKVAHLKHQTSFSHKPSNKIGTANANSHAKPKATVPKEPNFATAHRAVRQRSKNATQLGNDAKYYGSSVREKRLNGKSEEIQSSYQTKKKIKPVNKKIFSSKGEIGVFRNCKKETTVPKDFKLSSSKKLSEKPASELLSKLSQNPENQSTSQLEEHPLQKKVPKKNVASSLIMKENKNAYAVTGKSMRCSGNGGRILTDIGNHLASSRSLTVY